MCHLTGGTSHLHNPVFMEIALGDRITFVIHHSVSTIEADLSESLASGFLIFPKALLPLILPAHIHDVFNWVDSSVVRAWTSSVSDWGIQKCFFGHTVTITHPYSICCPASRSFLQSHFQLGLLHQVILLQVQELSFYLELREVHTGPVILVAHLS